MYLKYIYVEMLIIINFLISHILDRSCPLNFSAAIAIKWVAESNFVSGSNSVACFVDKECRASVGQLSVICLILVVFFDIVGVVCDVRAFLLVQKRRQHVAMCHVGALA